MRQKKVYISGAIAGLDVEERVAEFKKAEGWLGSAGFIPVNPFEVNPCVDGSCKGEKIPVVVQGNQHTWGCFLKYDLQAMLECDAIFMLEGWSQSRGATLELYVATQVGMTVMNQVVYK